jgi:beta-galactosidase
MEQTAGPLGWSTFSRSPQPGELRKICYQQLAHGADGQIWFRWRTCTVGREQYWHGLLGHDGEPNRRYHEAAQVAKEYRQLAPLLAGTTPHPDAAIIYDYDSHWALQIQKGYPEASHQEAIKRYYNALFRAGVNVDIVRPGDDFANYKLVLAPHLHIISDEVANQLVEYVRAGGVLLADCRTGIKDETNLIPSRTPLGLLSLALGIKIEEYESLGLGITDKEETTYMFRNEGNLKEVFTAIHYADWITPTKATAIARYDLPYLKPYAAVTRCVFGKGVGWYVGTIAKEESFYDKLADRLLADAGTEPLIKPPAGIEVVKRASHEKQLLFLINHTSEDNVVIVPPDKKEVVTNEITESELRLAPFGVAVLDISSCGGQ